MAVNPEVLEGLTSGIQSEVATYVFYVESAKKVKDKELVELLKQLALEEKRHFHVLESQYDSLVRSERWVSTADVLKQEGLPEIGEEMTSRHQGLIDEVKKASGRLEILKIALRLEIEARQLFEKLAAKAKDAEAKRTYQHLSKFEEGHEKLISGWIARLEK
nr:hypothetical protein [candidate division Zixibacteria bacterium]